MTAVRFKVPVLAEEDVVRGRFNEAGENPDEVVRWFTSDRAVTALITREGIGWNLTVQSPQFVALGSVELQHRDPGSNIVVELDVRGRGFMTFAGPAIGLASSKIQGEATTRLQSEFGTP